MPGGDRTGPMGMGPMTGRGAGYCAGYAIPGFVNAPRGRGFGGGSGRGGRGRRNRFHAAGLAGGQRAARGGPAFGAGWGYGAAYAPPFAPLPADQEEELDLLKRQAEGLAGTLDEIKKRIAELEAQPQEK